jgi:hypothetical protein
MLPVAGLHTSPKKERGLKVHSHLVLWTPKVESSNTMLAI